MATRKYVKAAPRLRTGSGRLNQMRREGWLPAVIYGRNVENQNLKIDSKTFEELIAQSTSDNILVNLDIDTVGQRMVFLQSLQHDALSGHILHADFLAIDEKTEITAHVPVHANGEAVGVKAGGLLENYVHSLEIKCLPSALPDSIEVDVTTLELGASLHISDLKLPAGVTPTHAPEVVVFHVSVPAATLSEGAE